MNEEMNIWQEKSWAVVGFDREKARKIMIGIEFSCGKIVTRKIQSTFELRTEFSDGTKLTWVRASENSRGRKFGKMWCDKNINKQVLDCVILPCYFGKREDIIWI